MLIKTLFFCGFVFAAAHAFCQQAGNGPDVEDVSKISLVAPAISYEKRVHHLQTVAVQAFLNINFGVGYSSSLGNTSFLYANPAAGIQYRYYYNGGRREAKGRQWARNSMNYIAPVYTIALSSWSISNDYYGEDKRRPVHNAGLVWGMQRNYSNRFSLDINTGPGIVVASTTVYNENGLPAGSKTATAFSLIAQVRIGLWLNRR